MERQYRRGLDALDPGAVPLPVHRAAQPRLRDGHLREQYDTIVFAEMATRQIMDGMRPGTVPGQYAGGIGEEGAQALRDFVTAGGTLVTMGNAASFAIEQFNLPVANALAGLRQDQFFCSGSLLRVEIHRPRTIPLVAGLPAMPAVMFERNQAFDTRPAFAARCWPATSRTAIRW